MSLLDNLFRDVDPNTRFCYLRASVLRNALGISKNLDALLGEPLCVPGNPVQLKKLPANDKLEAIVKFAEHLSSSKTAFTSGNHVLEIISYALYFSDLSVKDRVSMFAGTKRESDIKAPVVNWIKSRGLQTYEEIPLGRNKADVLGYKAKGFIGFLSPAEIVSVELKNDRKDKRAADQLTSYRMYSSEVYLACTPDFAMENVEDISNGTHIKRWVSSAFDEKIRSMGSGILLVEGDDVYVHFRAGVFPPKDAAIDEVVSTLKGKRPL
ncbi:MAG: hypothetical protein ACYDAR_22340 [Thermomicrobiales bacterium]